MGLMDNALNEKDPDKKKVLHVQFIRMRLIKTDANYLKTKSGYLKKGNLCCQS